MGELDRLSFGMAALGLALAMAGCSTSASQPFQQRSAALAAYGYSEVKRDPSHYSVSYSDSNARGADAFLELRAAQIAQGAGFRYFAFEDRGRNVVRRTENDINYNDVPRQETPGGGTRHTRDMFPQGMPIETTRFFYSWGRVVLLTDDEARGNTAALRVSDVMARSVGTAAP